MKKLLTAVLLCSCSYALACSAPPITLFESDRELVSRSPNIALAKVSHEGSGASKQLRTFTFNTIEIIRGEMPKTFTLQGYSVKRVKNTLGDFSKHQQPEFWASAANTIMPGDCSAYGVFELDGIYLVFYEKPSHVRSFEEIRFPDDLWLNVVKLLVKQIDEQTRYLESLKH